MASVRPFEPVPPAFLPPKHRTSADEPANAPKLTGAENFSAGNCTRSEPATLATARGACGLHWQLHAERAGYIGNSTRSVLATLQLLAERAGYTTDH